MKKIFLLSFFIMTLFLYGCSYKKRSLPSIEGEDIILTLYSWNGKSENKYFINSLGHSFVTVKNLSTESIYIKDYEITTNDELCFGTWGITDKWGICYDLEPSFIKYYDRYFNRVSISIGITKDDVDKINDIIETSDEWTILKNCSYFATKVWNACVDDEYQITYKIYTSAVKLCNSIEKFENKEYNREIIGHDNVFYYDNGEKYQLVFTDNL